ncbi:GNAT family N-acetyltransferase [Haloimpatiens sp. FM7315]|uniref:GNAT family N-acetyltransferase n=1 Tax=Haloimpatiens sp. FM7315 TaxID=3298609 RepID=UPI0035A2A39B
MIFKNKWSQGMDDFKDALFVRTEVFVKEQNVPLDMELDEYDNLAYHLVIYDNDKPIGVGRFVKIEDYYLIGRVAILKEYRGKGYGEFIMKSIIKKVKELGGKKIKLHAQVHAEKFYEKLGFKSYGEIFYEAGIKHVNMEMNL